MSDQEPPERLDPDGPRGRLDPDAVVRRPKPAPAPAEEPGDGERLNPDAAIADRRQRAEAAQRANNIPVLIDTRKYQWIIGGIGLTIVVIFSILLAAHGGNGTPGIAAGQTMHRFVAPLATSKYTSIPANAKPKCNPAKPNPQGLNICNRQPTVLAFFATGGKGCVQQVDTLQTVSKQFPGVLFAAVALGGDRNSTLPLVRSHHWTIPIAYDSTDVVGELYGIEVCPIIEVAKANGVVQQRLIGQAWARPATLAAAVRKLVG